MMDKKFLKKTFLVCVTQIVIAGGGAFMVASGTGNDPVGVFIDGCSKLFKVSYGRANLIFSIVLLLLFLLLYRKRITITTFLTAVIPGLFLDTFIAFLQNLPLSVFFVKYIYPLIGCAVLGSAVAAYLTLDFGASIIDNVVLLVSDVLKSDYRKGFLVSSAFYLAVGILLGGVWGYATIVVLLGVGNVVNITTPFFEKTIAKWSES